MAAKKRMTKKERERRHRRRFWAGILLVSLAAAFCVLVTLSEQMTRPFLPTWKEIFQKVGLAEAEPLDSELRVHVIDVGNADAILVQNKGASLLIDAGEKDDGERVLAYLREQGVEQIQFVTTLKTTTLSVADLLAEGGSWFALEHDGLGSRRLSAAQAESLKCRMR